MPLMPDVVAKTSYFRIFDEHINAFGKKELLQAIRGIERGQTIRGRVQAVAGISKPGLEHILNHWLSDDAEAWWPGLPVNDLLTEAFYQAYQTMLYPLDADRSDPKARRRKPLPLETLWLCAGYHMNMVVSESPYQVTLLLMTPATPDKVEGYLGFRQYLAKKLGDRAKFAQLGYRMPREVLPSARKYTVPEPFLVTAVDDDHGPQPFIDFTREGCPAGISTRRPLVRKDEMRDPGGDVLEPLPRGCE